MTDSANIRDASRQRFDDLPEPRAKSPAHPWWHAACSTGSMAPTLFGFKFLRFSFSGRIPALALVGLMLVPEAGLAQEAQEAQEAREAQQDPDGVTLAEIIPLLASTPAGEVIVAPAPAPGQARRVRRSQVLRAMRRAGLSAAGLAIPRTTTVRRASNELEGDALRDRALPSIEASLAPCTAQDIRLPRSVTLPPGHLDMRVDAQPPHRSGRTSGVLIMESGGVERRLPFSARVACPPPTVQAGATIRILARFGNVMASAPGEATQSGRVGEVIRVRNTTTRRALRGRILDGRSVEVVQ